MKLYIFGSCSGTEPTPGRKHVSFAIEINDRYYWFDAGEGCSYTAHLMGVDLHKVADIFISHPHMDHVGGLCNLLWNIRKLTFVKHQQPVYGDVNVYIPNMETFDGVMKILKNTEGNFVTEYNYNGHKITDSTVLKNDDIEVIACHNHHLEANESGWQSFSFLIKAEGKRIIYSGDIKGIEDISEFLEGGCDVLLVETGHHLPQNVCRTIKEKGYPVKEIFFIHHGRAIIDNYDFSYEESKKEFPNMRICEDQDVYEI